VREQTVTRKKAWVGGLAALLTAAAVFAADPEAGREKSRPCAACHGADGNSPSPEFPRLAGQYADYLVKALRDYKSGARKNPVMAPQAANLSRRDMEDLAAYYSRQQGLYDKR
jgi:cytochrome c553